jgi:hypothetical protein
MGEEDDCTVGIQLIVIFQYVIEYPELIASILSHTYLAYVKKISVWRLTADGHG